MLIHQCFLMTASPGDGWHHKERCLPVLQREMKALATQIGGEKFRAVLWPISKLASSTESCLFPTQKWHPTQGQQRPASVGDLMSYQRICSDELWTPVHGMRMATPNASSVLHCPTDSTVVGEEVMRPRPTSFPAQTGAARGSGATLLWPLLVELWGTCVGEGPCM